MSGPYRVSGHAGGYRLLWVRSGRVACEFRDGRATGNYFTLTWRQVFLLNVLQAVMRVPALRRAAVWVWGKIRVNHHFNGGDPPDLGGFTLERKPN